MSGSPALAARDLVVHFGDRPVIEQVGVDLRHGELLSIVGPNGTGKSTLVAVLAGDLAPDAGSVEVLGQPLSQWRLKDLARERAVLTQEQRIAFPFEVSEVVRMGRAPWRGRPEEDLDDREVAAAMQVTEVTALAQRTFSTLSGGEKARASFARILAQRTGILLLDEPTAALDIGHQESVLATARAAAERGCAVAVVVHDLSLAAAWSDRMVLLANGRVAAEGTPQKVLDAELLTQTYRHPIEVLQHPVTGDPLVLADRRSPPIPASAAPSSFTPVEQRR